MEEQREEDLEDLTEELETESLPKSEKTIREREELEDDEILNPRIMAAVFAGLVVLAAIICAVLWHFTHLEREDTPERGSGSVAQSNDAASTDSTLAATATPIASPTPTASSAPSVSPTPTVTAAPTPAVSSPPTAPPETQTDPPVKDPVSGTTAMAFAWIDGSVTPKDVINLRSEPSTLNTDNIAAQAKNGDILERTGINEDTGWTRLDYNGQTLYAVTQYLTTDLSYKTPVQAANSNRVNTMDGRVILFTDLNDNVTPKEYVNLRTEPSTSEGDSTVRCQISAGEVLHRTGCSPDAGWSRVEYNGEILYVVSSYVYTVE